LARRWRPVAAQQRAPALQLQHFLAEQHGQVQHLLPLPWEPVAALQQVAAQLQQPAAQLQQQALSEP
jgi:hypothetical protein